MGLASKLAGPAFLRVSEEAGATRLERRGLVCPAPNACSTPLRGELGCSRLPPYAERQLWREDVVLPFSVLALALTRG